MPNLRDSIHKLLHLAGPLPLSITDELRLNHGSLLELQDNFKDIASEMHVWTFYETVDSLLSGHAAKNSDEVHFSAPLASIKSTLVGCRYEKAFSLEAKHATCASFGPGNQKVLELFLEDLGQAVNKAQELSAAYVHTPLHLSEHVYLDLIGFYDDPDPNTESDVRLYISKPCLKDFLDKGPEVCLKERLRTVAGDSHHGPTAITAHKRPASSGGDGRHEAGALNIYDTTQESTQNTFASRDPEFSIMPDIQTQASKLEIVVKRPSVSDIQATASRSSTTPGTGLGLAVPSLWTPQSHRPSSRDSTTNGRTAGNDPAQTTSSPPASTTTGIPVRADDSFHNFSWRNDVPKREESEQKLASKGRPVKVRRASGLDDLTAGFSRPDPNRRKFIWIHTPYNNPHWIKVWACDKSRFLYC